ncbi:hypothetical protein K1719_042996 [Acacia pycnantha]|nr:hypothetical protein K1719_042996 [Acacia pycnantha]
MQWLQSSGASIFGSFSAPNTRRKAHHSWVVVQDTFFSTKDTFERHRVVFIVGTSVASVATAWIENEEFGSRLHILEEFNAGLFDYLIATDDSHIKEKDEAIKENNGELRRSKKLVMQKLDYEFGVVRGIDFKNVYMVINFEMPRTYNSGSSVSLVSTDEMETLEEIRSFIGDDENNCSNTIAEFPLLTKNAMEFLCYQAEDVATSVTRIEVRESRA